MNATRTATPCQITLHRHLRPGGATKFQATVRVPYDPCEEEAPHLGMAFDTDLFDEPGAAERQARDFALWKGLEVVRVDIGERRPKPA